MDRHQFSRTLHPNTPTNNKPLTSSTSTKRLSRKPSLLLLTSPKSKQQSNSETESQHIQFQSPTTSRFTRKAVPHQQSTSIELNNICYISPRNCKNVMSNFFTSYHPSQRDQGVRVSVERIQTQEVIQYCQQGGSQMEGKGKNIYGYPQGNVNVGNSYINSYGKMLGHRKKLSRTSNQFHDIKKNVVNDSSFCRTDAKKKQVSIKGQEDIELNLDMSLIQIQSQLSLKKQENKSLMTENSKMKCRVEDLRQQNEYLYRQIESFNTKIAELKQQNDQIKNLQLETAKRLQQAQHQLSHTKNLYQPLLKTSQKHLILEYIYKKLRHEHETTTIKNTTLTIQNKRLYHKISVLEKMLQDHHSIQHKLNKSRVRELSPVCNNQRIGWRNGKENVEDAGQDARERKFDVQVRFKKVSRREEDFFQLSPQ